MSDETVVRYCAPTLAGIKTGSLFSIPYKSKSDTENDLRQLNQRIRSKGLKAIVLGQKRGRSLILIYRRCYLEKDLKNENARIILDHFQYPQDIDECISYLTTRVQSNQEFPHEIGLFLGYPIEDILGFINNKAKNSKYTGIWKVYGDVIKAKKTFEQFKQCTETYCKVVEKGLPLERLLVAV